MALGALSRSGAQLSVAVTGVAGPGGGSCAKPVGTVCFGWVLHDQHQGAPCVTTVTHRFHGDRAAVRTQSIVVALDGLLQAAGGVDRPA
jgi:nicotinamide-nucleotide amidase